MFPLLTLLFAIGLVPVHGHNQQEYDDWLLNWEIQYHADGPYAYEMLQEKYDFLKRHPHGPTVEKPAAPRQSQSSSAPAAPRAPKVSAGTEQWRPLVANYFGEETDLALCLMGFESKGDPGARNTSSGAAGLMQVMPFWAPDYGVSYEALFDPETNIRIAKGIRDQQGWRAWSPYKRGECH